LINRGSIKKAWLALVAGALFATACGGINVAGPKIANSPITPITSSTGNFDAVEIDQANHRIYVADRDHGVDVFDITTGHAKFLTAIVLPSSPNGLAIAPDLGRLYAGTANGMVEVLDINPTSPTTGKVVAEVVTGGKEVDLLDYSATRHQLAASNGPDGTIATIDTKTNTLLKQIKIGNPLEQPRFNPTDGMLYVTAPDADALFQVDPSTGAIKNKTTLGNCKPVGLAINPRTDQALIACDNWTISWDLRTAAAQTFNQASHGDVVSYDPRADRFLVATPGPITSSAVAIFGGSPIAYVSSVFTGSGGKAAVYDDTNKVVYTTDVLPNRAGLLSFTVPDASPTLSSLLTLAPLAALLPLIVLVLIIVGRQADPIRRPEPLLTRAEAKQARLERAQAASAGRPQPLQREGTHDPSQA
jgi:DNA-binding beta-propeller fold protein YncE